MRFSSPNPTFSACCGCWETFIPFGLRVSDSPMAWRRQYQYNLHSPLQPSVVKALLLVLRSSAALALAAVAPLCVAQFIRIRTARSPTEGFATGLQLTVCRLQTSPRPVSIPTAAGLPKKISRPDSRHDYCMSGRGLTERIYARVPEQSDGNPAKRPPDYQKNKPT